MANLFYNLEVTIHESYHRETKANIINTRVTPTIYEELERIRKELGFEKMPDMARHIFTEYCMDYRQKKGSK